MLFSHGNSSYSHCKELEPTVLASEGHRMHPLVFCGHPTPANTDISTIFLSFAIMLDTHLKKKSLSPGQKDQVLGGGGQCAEMLESGHGIGQKQLCFAHTINLLPHGPLKDIR